jgi:hypothetical protein
VFTHKTGSSSASEDDAMAARDRLRAWLNASIWTEGYEGGWEGKWEVMMGLLAVSLGSMLLDAGAHPLESRMIIPSILVMVVDVDVLVDGSSDLSHPNLKSGVSTISNQDF